MFLPLTVRFMFVVQQTGVMPHSCPVGHSALVPRCPSDGGPGPYVPPPPKSRAASPSMLGESCNARQAERKDFSRRRWTEDGIFNDSRYLATVLRAMSTPSFLSTATSWSSDSTASAGSLSISSLMRERTASAEWLSAPSAA